MTPKALVRFAFRAQLWQALMLAYLKVLQFSSMSVSIALRTSSVRPIGLPPKDRHLEPDYSAYCFALAQLKCWHLR